MIWRRENYRKRMRGLEKKIRSKMGNISGRKLGKREWSEEEEEM